MQALLTALGLFAFAWLAHVAWWRIAAPRRHSASLLALFVAIALAALLAAPALPGRWLPAAAELPAVLVLYLGAAASYLILYTAVEQTSPTVALIRVLAAARERGCTREELGRVLTDDLFVRPRLEALVADGVVAEGPGGWSLTPRGRRAACAAVMLAALFRIRENA
jgi:hypothetical protein